MVLLEAMALERPVVATDFGGVREIVVNEQTGLVVPLEDSEAFAAAVARLLSSDAERAHMGAAGRRQVEQCFGAKDMLAAYASLYRNLVNEHRSRVGRSRGDSRRV